MAVTVAVFQNLLPPTVYEPAPTLISSCAHAGVTRTLGSTLLKPQRVCKAHEPSRPTTTWCPAPSLRRSGSGSSDVFGPAAAAGSAGSPTRQHQQAGGAAIAMQPLPLSSQAPQQQQQQAAVPGSPSAAGVRARHSRLGQQQQQQQQQAGRSSGGRSPQFTLGGDDTL